MNSVKRFAFQIPLWTFMVVGSAFIMLAACTGPRPKSQVVGGALPTEPQSSPSRGVTEDTAAPTRPAVALGVTTPHPTFTPQPTLTPSLTPSTPSITPLPTLTPSPPPSTPSPLPQSVLASCPVSLPNLTESPDPYYISVKSGYGNPERTMFIGLWPGGRVFFCPNCAGGLFADGSLGMKFWFYRTIPGEVVIEGRRLEEPGSVAHLATLRGPADGYEETGFHPAGLVFPEQGCWEVTARIGEARMTFVTLIVWIPFDRPWPGWLPEKSFLNPLQPR